ncbi:DUF7694 domain-containing protein [Komagataeibacter melaceti]|uniref:DUF7694 domain-containing protein n=1 Tax=Komagataeibacter melaceti TaxID=2766577 RepID=UPI001314A554|nr:hypothetical protein [Komagataeibacter melaceti]
MRNLYEVNQYRITSPEIVARFGSSGDSTCGFFMVPSPTDQQKMKVIASVGDGWDHVSVSRSSRCPNWPEMELVKRLFFADNETCMQLHVPVSDHISVHPYCLHIWRPHAEVIPMPPSWMVA